MRNQLSSCLLAVLLSATSAFAQIERVLEMKMTMLSKDGSERGGGTIIIALSKAGMRGEVNMQMGQGVGMKSVILCKTDTPNTNYLINDANRTYTEIDLSQPTQADSQRQEKDQWTVETLGQEKLLDYQTQHVLAKPKKGTGQSMELWIATDFLDFETYSKLQACSGGSMDGGEGLAQALKEAGAEGMPLKVVVTTEEGGRVRMEVVKAEKKSLPASTFEIPAGYIKLAGGTTVATGPEAEAMKARMEEARKKLEEQMKNMSPEQRAVIEKMLEQRIR